MRAIYLIPFLASLSIATERGCTVLELLPCAFLIDDDRPSTSGWPVTEPEMDVHCERSLKVTKCMNDFAVRCTEGEFASLSQFLREKHEIMVRVCEKGSKLRRQYLNHAPCMNRHHQIYKEKCGELLEFKGSVFQKSHCEIHATVLQCHYQEIKKACGENALSLVEELLGPANDMMDKLCQGGNVSNNAVFLAFMQNVNKRSSVF